jgi:hypothetical protein
MITGRQSVKLLDFGLAKQFIIDDSETAVTADAADAIAGTTRASRRGLFNLARGLDGYEIPGAGELLTRRRRWRS